MFNETPPNTCARHLPTGRADLRADGQEGKLGHVSTEREAGKQLVVIWAKRAGGEDGNEAKTQRKGSPDRF